MSSFNTAVKYNHGAIHNCTPEWEWTFGQMADYDLWVVLSGSGTMQVNDDHLKVSAGSVLILTPQSVGHGTHDPNDCLKVMAVHFDFIGNSPLQNYFHCKLESVFFLGELIQHAIIAAGNNNHDDACFWLGAALKEVMNVGSFAAFGHYHEKIESLCSQIIKHPEKPYKVSEMAGRLCLCKDHFSRVFKARKGVSPQDFVVRSRIVYAQSLLLSSNMTVAEIADKLGYSSVNFFNRQFKERTGKTPMQWRKGK